MLDKKSKFEISFTQSGCKVANRVCGKDSFPFYLSSIEVQNVIHFNSNI